MSISSKDVAKQYFKRGAQIEISSNKDEFNGSWYTGTVIRPPIGNSNKVLVEYATLFEEGRPVREALDVVQLRPPPPPENHITFKSDNFVDAYHNQGWWEGFITRVVGVDEYMVLFHTTKEELPFKASQLRRHRDWVEENGTWEWDPPLEDRPNDVSPLVNDICMLELVIVSMPGCSLFNKFRVFFSLIYCVYVWYVPEVS